MRYSFNSSRTIYALSVAYFIAVMAIAGVGVWSDYRFLKLTRIDEAHRVAALFEERFQRTLRAADAILQQAQSRAEALLRNGQDLRDFPWESLKTGGASLPDDGSLWIIGANGDLKAGSTSPTVPPNNYADREFFPVHKAGLPFFTSGGNKGKITGKYHWRVSRRINGPDGAFAGAVLAQLETGSLEEIARTIDLGEDSVFALYRSDGPLMIRFPMEERFLNASLRGDPFFEEVLRSPEQTGLFQRSASADGLERLYAWRKMSGRSLIAFIGIPSADMRQAWLQQASVYGAALLVSLLPLGFLLTIGAITARNEARQRRFLEEAVRERTAELRTALAEAQQANQAKSRFLAAASHDLRQPLQALNLYFAVLAAKLPAGETIIANVENCLASLSALLTDMLDLSKLDAGVVTPSACAFSVNDVLGRIVSSQAPAARAKGLKLRWVRSRAVGLTDPVLFERLVTNFVSNAIRYTERGGVVVGCRHRQGTLWVEVWDTGIGVPADKTAEIFEEFRQLGNPERSREKGSGLGLAIVRRTAVLLGLRIHVSSHPGRGSVFAVELPVSDAQPAVRHAVAGPAPGTLRVGVVEDDADVRKALAAALEQAGHQVVAAASAPELLARLGAQPPDVLIADYRLTDGQTGLDAISHVRAGFDASIEAVILTGETGPDVIRRIVSSGCRVLHKPLRFDAIDAFLAEIAKRRTVEAV